MKEDNAQKILSLIGLAVALVLAVAVPVAFFPFLSNVFDLAKYTFVVVASLLFLIVFALFSFLRKTVEISRSLWTVGFGLLGISTALSIIFSSPNKSAGLTGASVFLIAVSLLFITLSTAIRKRFTVPLLFSLGIAGVVVTVFSVLEKVGVNFPSLFALGTTATPGLFPNGGALINFSFLVITFVALVTLAVTAKQMMAKMIAIAFSGVLFLGLIVNGFGLLPGQPQSPVLLPFQSSWSIALDVLKTPRTAILGVGPTEYADAFSIFKPAVLNTSPYWFVRFGTAHNLPLDIVVTHGVVGVIALAVLVLATLASIKRTKKEDLPLVVAVVATVLLLLVFPANPVIWIVLTLLAVAWQSANAHALAPEESASTFVLVSAHTKTTRDERHVATGVVAGIALLLVVLAGAGLYINGKSFLSRMVYAQGLRSFQANKAKETYDKTRQAIVIAPYHEDMRRTFSQVNLLIAQGLLQNKDISDADRKTAITLIQQSIDEGKAAVALNSQDSTNWVALAGVYDSLIGAANQADQWTVAAYTQAIIRDPANPKLRVDLGGVFRKLKNNDQASRLFEQAAQLKPDYANAYFNMADIAKEIGKKDQELALLQKTIQYLATTDPQYKEIKSRIDILTPEVQAATKDAQKAQTQPTLPPSASPTPTATSSLQLKTASTSAKPKVELTQDAGIATNSAVPEVNTEK